MRDLAVSFDDVAAAYERGRPRYDHDTVAAVAAEAGGGPRLLDVGAGTGRMAGPLLEAGFDVVAVEPLDAMRAILARQVGTERALAGHAEALPLGDASVDGAVCCDAWHWFDGTRAADELHRVLRPGGGVVICITVPTYEDAPPPAWVRSISAVLTRLRASVDHPHRDGTKRPAGFDGDAGFERLRRCDVPFVHRTDREGMLAHYRSMSFVASLEPPRRAQTLAELEAILVSHDIDGVDVPYRAELWITRRRPAPAPPAGRRAAAS